MLEKMAGVGVDLRRPSGNTLVDLITLETQKVDGCRVCRFLPAVAQKERSEYLTSLEAFMTSAEMEHARYGVITLGPPIRAMDRSLRRLLQAFHRKLSRWSSLASQRFGIEVIIRCTESTRASLEDRGLEGKDPSYHFHANVVYRPRSFNPLAFATFLSWTRRFFGAHWSDRGTVKDVREIVKYMIKPTDLADASGEELVWLFESTQKLKMLQALGRFATYRRTLKEARLKTKGVCSGTGVREIVFVKKDKRTPSSSQVLRDIIEPAMHALISRLEREEDDAMAAELVESLLGFQADLDAANAPSVPTNMIIAVLTPASRDIHYSTPAVMVAGFTSLSELSLQPKFALLRAQAMAHWKANGAPTLDKVHQELATARAKLGAGGNKKFKNRKKWARFEERRQPRRGKAALHREPGPRLGVTRRVRAQSAGAGRA